MSQPTNELAFGGGFSGEDNGLGAAHYDHVILLARLSVRVSLDRFARFGSINLSNKAEGK